MPLPLKTYCITFAGRQDRMSLLVDTMTNALRRGIITEWHVWDYSRTPDDAAWIQTLSSIPGVIVRVPTSSKKETYEECYLAYTSGRYGPETVFLKCDDDIVYIDVDALDAFIKYRRLHPEIYLLSANVINNVVCTGIQKQHGYLRDVDISELHTNGAQAEAVHRAFLAGEKPTFDVVTFDASTCILNINFVSWLGADLDSVCLCESVRFARDEQHLASIFPGLFSRPVAIYGPLIVSHLSFYTQDASMDIAGLIESYRTQKKVLCKDHETGGHE